QCTGSGKSGIPAPQVLHLLYPKWKRTPLNLYFFFRDSDMVERKQKSTTRSTMMSQAPERTIKEKIGMHDDGIIGCDQVLACFMLKQLPEYKEAKIISYDYNMTIISLETLFNAEREMKAFFPHATFLWTLVGYTTMLVGDTITTMSEPVVNVDMIERLSTVLPAKKWTTRFSTSELVFKHFGHRIISVVLECPLEEPKVETIFKVVYEYFIEEISALNGHGDRICELRITTNLGSRIRRLNPPWTAKQVSNEELFLEAMEIAGREFMERIRYYGEVWWPARDILLKAVETRFQVSKLCDPSRIRICPVSRWLAQVDESGAILELPHGGIPWRKHLLFFETNGILLQHQVFFVIFKNLRFLFSNQENSSDENNSGTWMIQAVLSSREVLLPAAWRGVQNPELEEKSRLPGIRWVDKNGNFGWHDTREGAISMARHTIAHSQSRVLLLQALGKRFLVDKSGQIVEISSGFYQSIKYLFHFENKKVLPKYEVILPAFGKVPLLPKAELEKHAGLDGIIFVHASGYLGGHEARDGVIRMAKKSIAAFQPRVSLLKAMYKRFLVDGSGHILVLTSAWSNWEKHFFHLEAQGVMPKNEVFFIIFNEGDISNTWKVQAVPISLGSTIVRQEKFSTFLNQAVPLHAEWRGLQNPELERKSGLPGIRYVYCSGYLGGHQTQDGAISMARKSLADSLKRVLLLKAVNSRFKWGLLEITADTLQQVKESFLASVDICFRLQGMQFEHLL
ncbi:unnamed protein product, partial [Darwinula stevensoni]